MKKRITILLLIVVLLLTFSMVACDKPKDIDPPKAELSSWMEAVDDNTPITKLAIPGSHDSGTIGMMSLAETQGASIKQQLEYGIRYFDIRVNAKKDGVIFHGPINGVPFLPIAKDIKTFMEKHPTEFLILDFQHFKNGGEKLVYDTLKSVGLLNLAVAKTDKNIEDIAFINSLTVKDVRGKVLVFFGNTVANDYDNVFLRNNDECTRDGSSLDSLYLGDDHKKGSEHFIDVALPKYFNHILEKKSGLLVLQGQLTVPMGSPRKAEIEHNPAMNEYTRNIANDKEKLINVNIIMRDFIESDSEKVLSVLSLNLKKGYIKAENIDCFTKLTTK